MQGRRAQAVFMSPIGGNRRRIFQKEEMKKNKYSSYIYYNINFSNNQSFLFIV